METVATAVMKTIIDAGYPLQWWLEMEGGNPEENGGKVYVFRVRCPVSNMLYVVRAPHITEAAVHMAIKLGFDLEE